MLPGPMPHIKRYNQAAGEAAHRIVRTIRKPRNDADGAIAPKPEWDGAFRAICCVAPLAQGGLPWASRRFVQLIPESRRRGHAGLIQRFLSAARDGPAGRGLLRASQGLI